MLNLSGANLYLNADTALAGTLNASTAKVTACLLYTSPHQRPRIENRRNNE